MERKRFLVVGLGRFGTQIARSLTAAGAEVIAVDADLAVVERLRDEVAHAVSLDATDPDALRSIEAEGVDAAVVAIGEDFQMSVLVVAVLRELGIATVVGRARGPREARILRAVGAGRVLQLEDEMGKRLAHQLLVPDAIDLLELSGDLSVLTWAARGPLVGRRLDASGLRQRYRVQVAAVRRRGEPSYALAGPDTVVGEGDLLVLIGREPDIRAAIRAGREGA